MEYDVEMAEVVLFHHIQGLTPGVAAFADELRGAGHTVHTPDLFDGRTFDSIEQGSDFVQQIGFGEVIERGVQAAEALRAAAYRRPRRCAPSWCTPASRSV